MTVVHGVVSVKTIVTVSSVAHQVIQVAKVQVTRYFLHVLVNILGGLCVAADFFYNISYFCSIYIFFHL